jgi:hypothetical protein
MVAARLAPDTTPERDMRDSNEQNASRDPYRDNDDVRDKIDGTARNETNPDTRSEARGDARENVGNHSRNTAANPTEGGNDRTKSRRDVKID